MKDNTENIALSVVEVEKKYTIDPTESVYGGGSGIVSWGEDNNLPALMTTCYQKSTTLGTVIDQTVNYICGDGVEISDDAAKWRKEVNRTHMTVEELVGHISFDFINYGNVAIQVIFNKLGNPVELYPLDVTRCRLSGDGLKVFYSKKAWTKYQTKAEEFPRFGRNDFDPEHPTQIYFWNGTGVKSIYNRAPWMSALSDALIEIEAGNYSLNAVSNGFSARYIFNFPNSGNKTDEQKKAVEKGIRSKFCGPDASNNFMLFWADNDKALEVTKIESDETPERFLAIRNTSRENIYASLRLSPLLCGVGMSNTGFATAEFSDSFKLYQRTVAEPNRRLIERMLDDVTMLTDAFQIKPFSITFENNN